MEGVAGDVAYTFTWIDTKFTVHDSIARKRLPYLHAALTGPGSATVPRDGWQALQIDVKKPLGVANFSPQSAEKIVALPARAFDALLQWAYKDTLAPLWAYASASVPTHATADPVQYWLAVAHAMTSLELAAQLQRFLFRERVSAAAAACGWAVTTLCTTVWWVITTVASGVWRGAARTLAVLFVFGTTAFVVSAIFAFIGHFFLPAAADVTITIGAAVAVPLDVLLDRIVDWQITQEGYARERLRHHLDLIRDLPPSDRATAYSELLAAETSSAVTQSYYALSIASLFNTFDAVLNLLLTLAVRLGQTVGARNAEEFLATRTAAYRILRDAGHFAHGPMAIVQERRNHERGFEPNAP
jgi:hypothetical protein